MTELDRACKEKSISAHDFNFLCTLINSLIFYVLLIYLVRAYELCSLAYSAIGGVQVSQVFLTFHLHRVLGAISRVKDLE